MIPRQIFVLPHPLPMLQGVGDATSGSNDTREAYDRVCQDIVDAQPDSIVFIHMHGGIHPDGVTFQLPEEDQFSDGPVADRELAAFIQTSLHDYDRRTYVLSDNQLPFTAQIFVSRLQEAVSQVPPLVLLGTSLEGAQQQYEVGSLVGRALKADRANHAVVLCGQLSHCLSEASAAGYVEGAEEYDAFMLDQLAKNDFASLMLFDPIELERVGEDLFRPLCLGLGILEAHQRQIKWRLESYETPTGIGTMVGRLIRQED